MQDLRRVFDEDLWLEDELPHLGSHADMGYMEAYEWDGAEWFPRRPVRPIRDNAEWPRDALDEAPLLWSDRESAAEWRRNILDCLTRDVDEAASAEQDDLLDLKKYEGEIGAVPSIGRGLHMC